MITWPVVLERQDELHGTGIEMNTTASLYQDGRIEASVHIWEITLLRGGHGSMTLLAYDAGGHRIWNSDPERWWVDGRDIGTWDRWGMVKSQLDADTLKEIASIGIYHAPAPNDVW